MGSVGIYQKEYQPVGEQRYQPITSLLLNISSTSR